MDVHAHTRRRIRSGCTDSQCCSPRARGRGGLVPTVLLKCPTGPGTSPDGSSHSPKEIEIQAATQISRTHSAVGRRPPGSHSQGEEGLGAKRQATRASAGPPHLGPLCSWAWRTASSPGWGLGGLPLSRPRPCTRPGWDGGLLGAHVASADPLLGRSPCMCARMRVSDGAGIPSGVRVCARLGGSGRLSERTQAWPRHVPT